MYLIFQISVNGLEILCLMVDRMGEDFKPHVTTGKLLAMKSSYSIVSALTSLLILGSAIGCFG